MSESTQPCAAEAEQRSPTRVNSLWFDDGNIILVAEGFKFRVHKSMLAKSSPVFRDLFTVPQPTGPPCEDDDSLPVVNMPDNGLHLLYLLKAIYDRAFFGQNTLSATSVEIATGIVSLAHKYDMRLLYADVIRRLAEIFFTSFETYEARSQQRAGLYTPIGELPKLAKVNIPLEPVFLINTARQIRTPELLAMLPIAFYYATTQSAESLTQGVVRNRLRFAPGNHGREALHPDDLRRIIAAQRKLVQVNRNATKCFHVHAAYLSPECAARRHSGTCYKGLQLLSQGVVDAGYLGSARPLARRDGWIDDFCMKNLDGKLCTLCQENIKRLHKEAREKVFNDMKKLFDLEAWP